MNTGLGRIRRLFGHRMEQELELRQVAEQAAALMSVRGSRANCTTSSPTPSRSWSFQASGVRRLLKDEQHRERDALLSVEQIGRQALTEMRRMLGVMRTDGEFRPWHPNPGCSISSAWWRRSRKPGCR